MVRRLLCLVMASLALSACTIRQFHAVDLTPGAAPPALQTLARDAQGGNKPAQLALGTRYETGDGVPVNLLFAERLYEAAATMHNGTIYVYQPPVGNQKYGTVMPVQVGPDVPGLPEARERLRALRERQGR